MALVAKHILRTVKEKCEEKIIPYVLTHNPKDPEMFRLILDKVPILKEDDKMRNILFKYKLIKSKRQPYSLKRLLTKARFTSNNTLKVTKCNRPNCGLCIHLLDPEPLRAILSGSTLFAKVSVLVCKSERIMTEKHCITEVSK